MAFCALANCDRRIDRAFLERYCLFCKFGNPKLEDTLRQAPTNEPALKAIRRIARKRGVTIAPVPYKDPTGRHPGHMQKRVLRIGKKICGIHTFEMCNDEIIAMSNMRGLKCIVRQCSHKTRRRSILLPQIVVRGS